MTYIAAVDPSLEIAASRRPGTSRLHKYGNNAAVGTSYTIIGSSLGTSYPFPTTAETLDIVSASTDDAAAGDGMRTIRMRVASLCCVEGTSPFHLWSTVSPGCYRRMGGVPLLNRASVSISCLDEGTPDLALCAWSSALLPARIASPSRQHGFRKVGQMRHMSGVGRRMLVTSGAGLVGSHLHEDTTRQERSLPQAGDGAGGITMPPDALGSAAGGYAGQRTAQPAA